VGELAEGSLVVVGNGAQPGRRGWVWVGEFGQPGAQKMIVSVGEEQGVLQPGVGDLVATAVGNPMDEAVRAQPPQVVGHLSGGDVFGRRAEEGREESAQGTVGEPVG
jgi:hypothetical protein